MESSPYSVMTDAGPKRVVMVNAPISPALQIAVGAGLRVATPRSAARGYAVVRVRYAPRLGSASADPNARSGCAVTMAAGNNADSVRRRRGVPTTASASASRSAMVGPAARMVAAGLADLAARMMLGVTRERGSAVRCSRQVNSAGLSAEGETCALAPLRRTDVKPECVGGREANRCTAR